MLTLDKMQNVSAFMCKRWNILNTVYWVFWLSDRVVDCIQIDYIWTLGYWYNAIDYSNFAYSYKLVCNFTHNKHNYAKLSIPSLIPIHHYVMPLIHN